MWRTSPRVWNSVFKNNIENLALLSSTKSALFWGENSSPHSRPYNSPFCSFSALSCDAAGRYWSLGDLRGNFRFIKKYANLYFHSILLILTEMEQNFYTNNVKQCSFHVPEIRTIGLTASMFGKSWMKAREWSSLWPATGSKATKAFFTWFPEA